MGKAGMPAGNLELGQIHADDVAQLQVPVLFQFQPLLFAEVHEGVDDLHLQQQECREIILRRRLPAWVLLSPR